MTEWYRNSDWNEEIEDKFFDKLSRARSQRDQYIVLQAIHLASAHPKVALRLIDFYFETRNDDFHDDRAQRAVATAHLALGGYEEALDNYLAILGGDDTKRDIFVGSPIEFAYLAARYKSEKHYSAALEQLSKTSPPEEQQFDPRFRYNAARALILKESGIDPAAAKREAQIALAIPEIVISQYPDVVWRLRGITRS